MRTFPTPAQDRAVEYVREFPGRSTIMVACALATGVRGIGSLESQIRTIRRAVQSGKLRVEYHNHAHRLYLGTKP